METGFKQQFKGAGSRWAVGLGKGLCTWGPTAAWSEQAVVPSGICSIPACVLLTPGSGHHWNSEYAAWLPGSTSLFSEPFTGVFNTSFLSLKPLSEPVAPKHWRHEKLLSLVILFVWFAFYVSDISLENSFVFIYAHTRMHIHIYVERDKILKCLLQKTWKA